MFTVFWVTYAIPVILLHIPAVQRKVADTAMKELSARLNVPVRIGKVNAEWFNRLVLEEVYLEDQDGKELFTAHHITAGFRPLPMLRGKFIFTTIRLFGFSLNLSKHTPADPLNLQFVIDAFASRDTTRQSSNIELQFNSVLIRRGNFRYDVASEAETPDKFNARHVDIRNISANISLKAFNKDSLNANIKRISFDETSGFELKKLSMNIVGNRDSAYIRNFEIRLPQTTLKVNRAAISTRGIAGIDEMLNKAPITLDISPSLIYLKELAAFIPAFGHFEDPVELSAEASGFINDINLKRLSLKYTDKMMLIGQMALRGITHPENAYVLGQVNKLYITNEGLSGLVNNFSKDPVVLPTPVKRLGTLNFTGEISGFFDNLVAYGKLSTSIGSVETDLLFGSRKEEGIAAYLKGTVSTSELQIAELFDVDNPFGVARFNISIDASRPPEGYFHGGIHATVSEFDYKNYRYENLQLEGHFQRNGFDGNLQINDANGVLHAEGMFRNQGAHSIFKFDGRLENFRPDHLNLTDKYESPDISVSVHADFTGNNIDNAEGHITIDSLAFNTEPSNLFIRRINIAAEGNASGKRLSIASDIVNGEVTGEYSFTTLVPSLLNTFKGYTPALINTKFGELASRENNFSLLFTIENTDTLSKTLKLPVTITSPARITGHYNNQYNKFRLEAFLPQLMIGKSAVESGYFICENPSDQVEMTLRGVNYNKKGVRNYFDLSADARDNKLKTLLAWHNNRENRFETKLAASALFVEEENEKGTPSLRTEISVDESLLVIKDTIWNIEESGITLTDQGIDISHFIVSHGKQHVLIDGTVSDNPQDVLMLDLNDIELSYIFDVLNIPVLQFGGRATGTFRFSDLSGSRKLNIEQLNVQDFSFNHTNLGRLNLYSEWNDDEQGILMLGSIYKNDSTYTDVNGYIYPVGAKEGLSLTFEANDIDVAFLQPFLKNFATNVKGHGFGRVRLYGSFKDLNVEGRAFVKDGGMGIDFLNTYYTFSDSIIMTPQSMTARNATVYDKFGNRSKIDVTLNHHHFRDLDYTVDVQANRMLVYDATQKINPLIFGSVFGSGTARIKGNDQVLNLDVNMRSEPNTNVSLDFMSVSGVEEYDFITFVDKNISDKEATDSAKVSKLFSGLEEEGVEIRANCLLDVTPDANIELIMDPKAGDKVKGYGSGSLQVEYGTRSDLRMYGLFNILSGNYNFSLQQLIHKDFKIREGSTVSFQGDPYSANINIDAVYNVTANIGDLDPSLIQESARTNVPVNCILKIDGMLQHPTISFDLELPGSNDELERKVKSYVNTEDMMSRQIVYLLVLNKFYTPDIYRTSRTNEFSAVTSAAISSQISSILSSITDKVQIGTNIRASQDGFSETEYEMLLSSQLLDNRLLFNGNFGYKNNPNVKNVFVGEFDIEYLLTRSGEIRLKAYNHANDMYRYLKQSLTTQGIGIMYRKDFSKLSEIFRRRKPLTLTPLDLSPVLPQDTTMSP